MTCPMMDSALADALFSDDSHLLAAGKDGVSLYNIESREQMWRAGMASTLTISGDGQGCGGDGPGQKYCLIL